MSDEPKPKPGARAMAAAQAILTAYNVCWLDEPSGVYVSPKEAARIIDQHLAAHDELLAACKTSAESPHHPTCPLYIHKHPRHRPGLYVASCDCHVEQARTALALAEPEQKENE